MGYYEMGIDVSLPTKDKNWVEAQKRELIINAWSLKDSAGKDVKRAAGTVASGERRI